LVGWAGKLSRRAELSEVDGCGAEVEINGLTSAVGQPPMHLLLDMLPKCQLPKPIVYLLKTREILILLLSKAS
jgi:hypothetical protein